MYTTCPSAESGALQTVRPPLDERELSWVLRRPRMQDSLFHRLPFVADDTKRLVGREAVLAQQAPDDGAGATHPRPAMHVDRLVRGHRVVNRLQDCAHQSRGRDAEIPDGETPVIG